MTARGYGFFPAALQEGAAEAQVWPTETVTVDELLPHEQIDPTGLFFAHAAHYSGKPVDGLRLVYDALCYAPRLIGDRVALGHIRGPALCLAVARYAEEVFGPDGFRALAEWGLADGEGVGEVVAELVVFDIMGSSRDDSAADFSGVGPLSRLARSEFDPIAPGDVARELAVRDEQYPARGGRASGLPRRERVAVGAVVVLIVSGVLGQVAAGEYERAMLPAGPAPDRSEVMAVLLLVWVNAWAAGTALFARFAGHRYKYPAEPSPSAAPYEDSGSEGS